MAYRDMTQEEMVTHGDALLEPKTQARLKQEALLAPLVEQLALVMVLLKSANVAPGVISAEIQKLTNQLAVLDARHDRKLRGVYYGLKAASEGTEDVALAETYAGALSLLFPDGLSITQASYQAEGGRAQLTENILDEDTEATLKSIQVQGENALEWLRQAIAAAKQLAALDVERERLLKTTDATAVSPGDRQRSCRQWINLIKGFDRLIPLTGLTTEEVRIFFGPLRDAAKDAGKKPL